MSAIGKVISGAVKAVSRAVASAGKVISSIAKGIGKVVSSVGKAVGNVIQQAIKDPIGTIAQVAAVATGQVWLLPVISAGQTIAAGGSLMDALKAAAISYAAGKLGSFAGEYASGMFEGATSKLAGSLAQGAITGATQAGLSGRDIMEGLTSGLISGGTGYLASEYVAPYLSKNLADVANITGETNKLLTGLGTAATRGALAAELKGQDVSAGITSALTGFGMKYGQNYVVDAAGNAFDAFGRKITEDNAENVLKLDNSEQMNDYAATLASKGLVQGRDFTIDNEGNVWNVTRNGYQGDIRFNAAMLGEDVAQLKEDPNAWMNYRPVSANFRDIYVNQMAQRGYVEGDDYVINEAGMVFDKYGNRLVSDAYSAANELASNEAEMSDAEGLLLTDEEREDLSAKADEAEQSYLEAAEEYDELQRATLETYNQRLEEWDNLGAPGDFQDFYQNYDDYQDDLAQYRDDVAEWEESGTSLGFKEYQDAKQRYDESGSLEPFEDWYRNEQDLVDFEFDPQGFESFEDYQAWKETNLPAEEFKALNDEFKQYAEAYDPFAAPETGTVTYNPVTGQWEQEKLPTTPEEFAAYRDNKITEAYTNAASGELYREDLEQWRAQGSPGDFGVWRMDKYGGYAPTGEAILQQRYEDSGSDLSYEEWLDQSKQEFEDNYIAQEREYNQQLLQNRIVEEEYNSAVNSGALSPETSLEDYRADREQWKASGANQTLNEWLADKQEWQDSGSELPMDEWQAEKYAPPEPEPEEEFRVEVPEIELAAPEEGGEIDTRTGITWYQDENGEWIGFDGSGAIYGEGGVQLYAPEEGGEQGGELDPVSGITWYTGADGSKIGIDADNNYYNESGDILWQPDYSAEFETPEGFTPDTEGASEWSYVPEQGETPTDVFGQIKDFLGGSFGQSLTRNLQQAALNAQRQIYGPRGRAYARTPVGAYQRAAQPLVGYGYDWNALKPGEQKPEERDEAFKTEQVQPVSSELFDPLKDRKWAPMSRIEGLGFAGKFINQEPISMSTFDQQAKPVQVQGVEQDTPMTTGWKTADELQAEKQKETQDQQFDTGDQSMFFDPTDVNLSRPWWEQPDFQQQQNIMPVYAAQGGLIDHNPQFYSEGGASAGFRHVKGDGDGTSDSVPAMLAADEYVLPADIVSSLGNGSSDAGAEILDQFVQIIREHKRDADPEDLSEDSRGPLTYLAEAYERVGA